VAFFISGFATDVKRHSADAAGQGGRRVPLLAVPDIRAGALKRAN
jgi:hypothetical protein